MKKNMLITMIMILCISNITNAQKLQLPSDWEQYRNEIKYEGGYAIDPNSNNGDNWVDVWQYQGKRVTLSGICPTCPKLPPPTPPVAEKGTSITNINNNYDIDTERGKVAEMKRANDINQQKVDNDFKMAKKENRREWILGGWRNANETSNQVAVWNDKYKSNISSTSSSACGSTTTPPTNGEPWTGPTTPTTPSSGEPWTGSTIIAADDPIWGGTQVSGFTNDYQQIPLNNGPFTGNTTTLRSVETLNGKRIILNQ